MDFTFVGLSKFLLSFLGGIFILVGTMIEPSIGVWVVSIGGSLLTSSLGKEDKTIKEIFIHLLIGVCWGIFGSQIIHSIFINMPQVAIAFFSAMFGVEATWYLIRNFREGSMTKFFIELITSVIPNFLPWFKKK